MPADVDLKILGESLKDTLSKSKIVSIDEFQKIYKSGVVQRNSELQDQDAMKKYGYKTKRKFFEKMRICLVDSDKNNIKITPAHHQGLGKFTVTERGKDLIIDISYNSPFEEIGLALIEGMNRCTN